MSKLDVHVLVCLWGRFQMWVCVLETGLRWVSVCEGYGNDVCKQKMTCCNRWSWCDHFGSPTWSLSYIFLQACMHTLTHTHTHTHTHTVHMHKQIAHTHRYIEREKERERDAQFTHTGTHKSTHTSLGLLFIYIPHCVAAFTHLDLHQVSLFKPNDTIAIGKPIHAPSCLLESFLVTASEISSPVHFICALERSGTWSRKSYRRFYSILCYSRLCSSPAGSSPLPESNFICPLLSLSIPLPVAPQYHLSDEVLVFRLISRPLSSTLCF